MMDICQKMLIGVADDGKVTDSVSLTVLLVMSVVNGGAVEGSYFIRQSFSPRQPQVDTNVRTKYARS